MTHKPLLPLALTLLFCPVGSVSASYFPHEEIRPYQAPTVVQKVRIKTSNIVSPTASFCTSPTVKCEMQYNRNKVGQPLTR